MMEELVAFLRARLDEDERIARLNTRRINPRRGEWALVGNEVRDDANVLVVRHTWPNEGEHIARWDPARVLAEVEARRRILEEWGKQSDDDDQYAYLAGPIIPQLLALPYADHPDYREEWRP
jgi:hypothetical protein